MIEELWNKISQRIDDFFLNRQMKRYLKVANEMKILIDDYLSRHSYKFTSKINPDPEPDWAKVDIEVKISVATYALVLKVWDEVCNYVYPRFNIEENHGVFLSFDLLE